MANTIIKFKAGQLDKLLATDGTAPALQEGTLYFADNTGNTAGSGRIYFDTKNSNNEDIRILMGAGDAMLTAGATQAADTQTLYLIGSQVSNANHAKTLASKISVIGTTINGNATSASKVNNKLTVGSKTYDGSAAITIEASDLGLSNALHFIGAATVAITDGSTTDPVISGYTSKKTGDVIIDKDSAYEYVWTAAGKWERLGPDGSYKVVQTAVSSPSASGSTTAFIDTISQNAQGVITVTKKNLDTTGTWSGNAATATTATKLGTATVGGAAKPIYLNAGTATACSSTIGSSTTPVYMNAGTITACGNSLTVSITGNAATATTATNATNIYSSASTTKAYVLGTTTASSANHATVYNASVYTSGSVLYGAAWNDYAEYRESDVVEPGRCIIEQGNDKLILSTRRMQPGAEIISDTFGFAIGETDNCKTPIATSGRVLAYPLESLEKFKENIGKPVCSGPNGTVSIMSDEEYKNFGYCAIGTISAVPDYEEWGAGNIKVNNRVWIRVR